MGCASSAPLVEQGKQFVEGVKDSVQETMAKGEKAIQGTVKDTTETIKDGISSGIDSVKESVHVALNTAEESVGAVAHKIGDNFNLMSSKTEQEMETVKTNVNIVETAAEAVSEAETVIMSETDQAREAFQSGAAPFFETVQSIENEVYENLNKVEKLPEMATEMLEDLETDSNELLGESVQVSTRKAEELLFEELETTKTEIGKEEPSPTFWEAAADAILSRKPNLPFADYKGERIFYPGREKSDMNFTEKGVWQNDIVLTDN